MPVKSEFSPNVEEVFCSGRILYHGQPVGLVLADTFEAAQKAAKTVCIHYSTDTVTETILPTVKDVADAKRHDRVVNIEIGARQLSKRLINFSKIIITGYLYSKTSKMISNNLLE